MDETGVCESCGRDGVGVTRVHRAYVTPATEAIEVEIEVLEEVERWCFPCRSLYPHEEVPASA